MDSCAVLFVTGICQSGCNCGARRGGRHSSLMQEEGGHHDDHDDDWDGGTRCGI